MDRVLNVSVVPVPDRARGIPADAVVLVSLLGESRRLTPAEARGLAAMLVDRAAAGQALVGADARTGVPR